jgi:hypothetical protein
MVLGLRIFLGNRKRMSRLLRDGFRAPYAELSEAASEPEVAPR